MVSCRFRRYPRNSPQAAGRLLAVALLANGEIKPCEWRRLRESGALERLRLPELEWHAVMDGLCQDLLQQATPGGNCLIDMACLRQWLDDIDDAALQALVIELCAEVIEADSEVHPTESLVVRTLLEHWVLPMPDQERVEPLVYGLDFQVMARQGGTVAPDVRS